MKRTRKFAKTGLCKLLFAVLSSFSLCVCFDYMKVCCAESKNGKSRDIKWQSCWCLFSVRWGQHGHTCSVIATAYRVTGVPRCVPFLVFSFMVLTLVCVLVMFVSWRCVLVMCLGDVWKVVASCPRNQIKQMAMSVRTDLANCVSFLCTHLGEKKQCTCSFVLLTTLTVVPMYYMCVM